MTAAQRSAARQYDTFNSAVLEQEIADFALEAHLAAESNYFLAHRGDYSGETKGTDVGFVDVHDFVRRAGAHELVHHFAAVELRVLDLAVELSVGEQAGATLAELHVGFWGQGFLAPQ